jgi:hypothetical protein
VKAASAPPGDLALASAGRATAWTLGAWAAVQAAGAVLSHSALAAMALQAGITEWASGKAFVTWSDPLAPAPSPAAVRRRVGIGAAAGAAAAALVVGGAVLIAHASVAAATPAWSALLFGALAAVLAAVRDELLLRGMVLKVARSVGGFAAGIALCGAAGAAARAGGDHVTPVAVLVDGLRGAALGAVWTRDRGAWMALGASTAWAWVLDAATGGALLDVRMGTGAPAESLAALLVVTVAATVAVGWARRDSEDLAGRG